MFTIPRGFFRDPITSLITMDWAVLTAGILGVSIALTGLAVGGGDAPSAAGTRVEVIPGVGRVTIRRLPPPDAARKVRPQGPRVARAPLADDALRARGNRPTRAGGGGPTAAPLPNMTGDTADAARCPPSRGDLPHPRA